MTVVVNILVVLTLFTSCGQVSSNGKPESPPMAEIQEDTCDSPDANINCPFIHMPPNLNHVMTLANPNEPGDRLVISGIVFKADGKTPYPNVILYAYQTDNKGYYSKSGKEQGAQKWHGRLHGWCKTDQTGRYEIRSIRPAPYPGNSIPAHIHMTVKPQNTTPYYITDFVFRDDPLISNRYLESISSMTGGSGIVNLKKLDQGTWTGERNISLKP
jgi:protocatechuate 3,4-dioxygenase, beta subunit